VSREKLSPQQWARLEAKLRKGSWPTGSPGTRRRALGWIKTLTGKLLHVAYSPEGVRICRPGSAD
jgi:hypothetical protein